MPDLDQAPWTDLLPFLRSEVLPVAVIVVGAYVALRLARLFVHGVVKTLLDREASEGTAQELSAVELRKRMETLDALGANLLRALVVVIAALMVLAHFGFDIAPAIAGIGVVGISVGLAAQHLVRDYLNGSLILIENQFARGDVVEVAGVSGTVEDFTLRRTTLRDLSGAVHTVPNGEIRVASNRTRTWARINEDVTVAAADVDRAIMAVEGVGAAMAADPAWKRRVLEAPKVDRVEALAPSGVTLKVLGTVRAADQWAAAGDFRLRLVEAFREAGIDFAAPG